MKTDGHGSGFENLRGHGFELSRKVERGALDWGGCIEFVATFLGLGFLTMKKFIGGVFETVNPPKYAHAIHYSHLIVYLQSYSLDLDHLGANRKRRHQLLREHNITFGLLLQRRQYLPIDFVLVKHL